MGAIVFVQYVFDYQVLFSLVPKPLSSQMGTLSRCYQACLSVRTVVVVFDIVEDGVGDVDEDGNACPV